MQVWVVHRRRSVACDARGGGRILSSPMSMEREHSGLQCQRSGTKGARFDTRHPPAFSPSSVSGPAKRGERRIVFVFPPRDSHGVFRPLAPTSTQNE